MPLSCLVLSSLCLCYVFFVFDYFFVILLICLSFYQLTNEIRSLVDAFVVADLQVKYHTPNLCPSLPPEKLNTGH